ncbi:MAG TPA: hypothetical protein PKH39_17905 [Woeseiaceae bacterium]|nr:hypothetical protein [Woeseiaceae bacterium]
MIKSAYLPLFLMCACMQPSDPAAAQASNVREALATEEISSLQDFLLEPFSEPLGYSMVSGNAIEQITKRYGAPNQDTAQRYPDPTSDAVLTSRKLEYDGISFVVGTSEVGSRSWIESIEITGAQHLLKHRLAVGARRDAVVAALKPEKFVDTGEYLAMASSISEERTDTENRPGETVRVEGYFELYFYFDAADKVKKIMIESVGH